MKFQVVRKTFLLSSICIRRKIGLVKILDVRFSMDLHILRCPEHDLNIFRKRCLSVRPSVGLYVCLQNFVDIVSQELMRGN